MKLLVFVCVLLIFPFAFADTGGGSKEKINISSAMEKAQQLVDDHNYKKAIKELKKVLRQESKNADAWNLLGYSQRKVGSYRKSGKSYKKALKLDPDHKGALEYQGELFIQQGELDKAQKNRDKLMLLCKTGCEELQDLEEALEAAM